MMQPQRRCVPLGSIIKLSVGRRGLNALQTERGRDVQPHMHLLTTSYFHSHEWGPHTDSPHCCQTVRAKTFHKMSSTQCREKLLGLHRAEPLGRAGSVFSLQEHESFRERARFREREMGCFSQKSGEQCHITLSSSCGLKLFLYHVCKIVYCKTGFTFVFPTVALFWWTFKNCCRSDCDGDWSSYQFGSV